MNLFRIIVFLVFMNPAIAISQVYKWVDKDGNIHFGDSPPEDTSSELMEFPAGPSQQQIDHAEEVWQETQKRREILDGATNTDENEEVLLVGSKGSNNFSMPGCDTRYPDLPVELNFRRITAGPGKRKWSDIEIKTGLTLLDKVKGNWHGTYTELSCTRKSETLPNSGAPPRDPKCNSISSSVKSPGFQKPDCKPTANFKKRVEHTEEIVSTGTADVKAVWDSALKQLLVESKVKNSGGNDHQVLVRYLILENLLYFKGRDSAPMNDDRPKVVTGGNVASVFYLSDSDLIFGLSHTHTNAGRGLPFTRVIGRANSNYRFRVSPGRLFLTESSGSLMRIWDLKK